MAGTLTSLIRVLIQLFIKPYVPTCRDKKANNMHTDSLLVQLGYLSKLISSLEDA
jgi:hypothetical protein